MSVQLIKDNWDLIREKLRVDQELTQVSYNTWFEGLEVVSLDNGILTLYFPGVENGAPYIQRRYAAFLQVIIEEVTGIRCQVQVSSRNSPSAFTEKASPRNEVDPSLSAKANLNPRYTFDNFVVGNNNKLAHAASLAVAESPAEVYNPLFIYGGVGLGKTHLMQSIAHFILKQNPSAKILYVTSENFTTELIASIQHNSTQEFRDKYRTIDVLMIDDIQFIAGKESTQEEVFHTFNALHDAKKQIIFSSDRPPKDIPTLEERLSSRFGWGLTVDIGSPDYETRMAILRKKEEIEHYNIDNEVIKYIATNIVSNIRELEGALTKVVASARLTHQDITVALAEEALKDYLSPNKVKEITPELIIETVAYHFKINPQDLVSSKRNKEIVYPRQIAMYLCRDMTNEPLQSIGKFLGKRDHSTIIHGYDKIAAEIRTNESLCNTVEILKKKIQSL